MPPAKGIIGFSGTSGGRASRATTRLLDATFPAYRSLLPSEWASSAEVTVGPLVEAVRRVALVADRNAPVRLEFSDGSVALSAGGEDEGRAEEQLEVAYEGEAITTAFNPQFLLDGLGRPALAERPAAVHVLDQAGGPSPGRRGETPASTRT